MRKLAPESVQFVKDLLPGDLVVCAPAALMGDVGTQRVRLVVDVRDKGGQGHDGRFLTFLRLIDLEERSGLSPYDCAYERMAAMRVLGRST